MNIRNLLVSVLILVCVLLSACAPAVPATQVPTSLPPTAAPTATAMPPSPTVAPPTQVADTASPGPIHLSEFPDAGEVLETVPLPVNPNRDSVYAFDSLWLPNDTDGTVTRWDPEARQVLATITVDGPNSAPYGDPVGVVATTDSIWVTSVASREIVRIDPNTNQITESIALGQVDGRDFVTTVMVGDDSNLWVWDYDRRITLRIDLKTKQVAATIPNVTPATVADSSVWAWDSQHSRDASNLLRIDPATDQIVAKIPLRGLTAQNASSENSIWLGHGKELLRIDTHTNQVIASLVFVETLGNTKVMGDTVWATVGPGGGPPACHDVQRTFLVRIDPKTNTVVGKIGLDCPWDIFQIENTIWAFAGLNDSTYGQLYAVLIRPNE